MTRSALLIAVMACGGTGGNPGDGAARDADPGDAGGGPRDAAGGGPGDAPAGTGEPAELAGITLAHNQIRARVDTTGLPAGALPPLAWDDALAATAAAWVRGCADSDGDGLVDHNPNRSAGHPGYVGENIFASTGTATAQAAVAAWAGEQTHYHRDTNTCDAGTVCGHYTQVVWRATQGVGCAVFRCAGLRFPSTIVCDYGPGGNIGNQAPY